MQTQLLTESDAPNLKKTQLLGDFINSDLKIERQEYVAETPVLSKWLGSLLADKRDMPMVNLQLNILSYLVPGVSLIYYIFMKENPPPGYVCHILGFLYVIGNTILFQERFILMLHYSTHRPTFVRNCTFLNNYVNWVLTPFYGIPCGVYRIHHCVMHHIENNHEWDISSTETYQRDSLLHFLMYYLRFSVMIYIEVPIYCIKAKRWDGLKECAVGMVTWASAVACLAKFVNFWATFWTLLIPVVICFLAMSFGNWSQHIFVDPAKPESNYHLTYNCIDSWVNQRTFNDGYHVIHHYNARMHWSEMPEHFHSETAQAKHLEEGALTFRGIHFFDVGILVMTGRLDKLAKHYVHLGSAETAPSLQAIEQRMRSWLKPMAAVKGAKKKA